MQFMWRNCEFLSIIKIVSHSKIVEVLFHFHIASAGHAHELPSDGNVSRRLES